MSSSAGIVQMIENWATSFGVPPGLAVQVATQESSLNPNATGSKGEQGLFQLMPSTAAQYGVTDAYDPEQNTQGGLAYLTDLYNMFGSWAAALAAYNWGPGNVAKYGVAAAPASTQAYVANALAAAGPTSDGNATGAVPYDPSSDSGPIIDVPGLDTSSSAALPAAITPATPNLILLAAAALAVYLAADLIRD